MKHRISRRQWKIRAKRGDVISAYVIETYKLRRWFKFMPVCVNADMWIIAHR